jgi:hypothetical protein
MTSLLQKRVQHCFLSSPRSASATRWAITTLLFTVLCPCIISFASTPAEYHPLSVELLSYLDVNHLHPGSTFFVKVMSDWTGLGCSFRDAQILEGSVVVSTPRNKRSGPSQLAASFDKVPCLGNKLTIDLVLAAAFFNSADNIPNSPFPIVHSSAAQGGAANSIQRSVNVLELEMAALSGKGPVRPSLKPGEVVGIKDLTLRMGAGPGKSSILESSKHDVWLDKEAVLLLVPASVALPQPSPSSVEVAQSTEGGAPAVEPSAEHETEAIAPNLPATPPASPAPPHEFLPCEPPACNIELPLNASEHLEKAMQSIAMRPLGYAPRPQREIGELDNDDALVWLGSHQFMVAFNPHKLIRREAEAASASTVRRIHAVILDTITRKVVSTADWELADRQPYLWQLSDNRVLAHIGNELRILREDLKVERRIPLDGPLAFVRTSPSGDLMAIAVTHERHSPELHRKLRDALGEDPDEEVQIRILDKDFQTVAQGTSSRGIMPPILLNEGQVRLLAAPEAKYRLEILPWQGKAGTIARFTSACLPSISSFAPDLLFVATCAPQSRIHEYRVLRPNGSVLLHGKSDPQNLGQDALGTAQKFAVKVLHATRAIGEGSAFFGSDLDSAEVRIYRADNGATVSALHTELPPPSRGAFALSSDGSQLAILSDSKISIFSLP